MAVARAVQATAAAMGKHDNRARFVRKIEIALEHDLASRIAGQSLIKRSYVRIVHCIVPFQNGLPRIGGFADRLHREREGLRHFPRFPFGGGFEGFDGPRLVEMQDGVELVR